MCVSRVVKWFTLGVIVFCSDLMGPVPPVVPPVVGGGPAAYGRGGPAPYGASPVPYAAGGRGARGVADSVHGAGGYNG